MTSDGQLSDDGLGKMWVLVITNIFGLIIRHDLKNQWKFKNGHILMEWASFSKMKWLTKMVVVSNQWTL